VVLYDRRPPRGGDAVGAPRPAGELKPAVEAANSGELLNP
jgi:hypothetical protein